MSETCGGCVYDGRPLTGVRVATGDDGRVRIGGPTLFERYDGQPGLTAEVLRDGWFLTSDLGRVDAEGRLHVLGRVDDVIVSGGLNVPAPAVADRLREHPGVREAEVVGVPDAEWGQAVVAVVAGDVRLEDLRDWVGRRHPRAWAPRRVVPVDALPLLPTGKVDRLAVERLALGPPAPDRKAGR
jgi:O-succinylbenzoic acid--CoA ligase